MPDLDKVSPSTMQPKKKTVIVNGVETIVDDIRSVQLNEKTGENEYQILHPETDAYQVITDPNRRFVSEEEKAKWNEAYNLSASALHYRGKFVPGEKYCKYDVIYLDAGSADQGTTYPLPNQTGVRGRRFFVFISDLENAKPENGGVVVTTAPEYDKFESNQWVNINFESYLAEYANNVYMDPEGDNEAYTFVITNYDISGKQYRTLTTSNNFTINPVTQELKIGSITLNGSTGTITATKFIGDLQGNADTADRADVTEQYVTYARNADGSLVDGKRTETGTKYVDDSVSGLQEQIDAITNGTGGAVLGNKLIVQKNGESLNGEGFDGSESQTVNITINTADVKDLLNEKKKIKDVWLPDTILGAMSYIGTFDAATGRLVTDLREPAGRNFRKGDYAIAITAGNLDPNGTSHTPTSPEVTYYLVGDWAVYNGDLDGGNDIDAEEWTKIDNTDAVRTVNEQIGDVKTYKGMWSAGIQYYAGDMVQYGDPVALYLCIKTNNNAEFSFDDFKIFGRVYQAEDGIELDEEKNTFRHTFKNSQTVEVGSETTPQKLVQGDVIKVSLVDMNDKYGHVNKNTVTYYEMPDDTWRPVWVNGEEFKGAATTTGPLDISHDYRDTVDNDPRVLVSTKAGEPNKVIVSHADAKKGAGSHESKVLTTPVADAIKVGLGSQFNLPNFSWNASGHIDNHSQVILELPTNLIQHEHFQIALKDGLSTIRSFTHEEFLDLQNKNRKFYDASSTGVLTLPTGKEVMGFFGQLKANGFYQLTKNYETNSDNTLYRAIDESILVSGGTNLQGQNILGSYVANSNSIVLGDSGVHGHNTPVVYSAVAVNRKGITVAGGQILEFGRGQLVDGEWVSQEPSDALVIGGLFFRDLGPKQDSNGVV